MISFDTALQTILASARTPTGVESVPLVLSAGRILASAITAQENFPAEANSAMDGYAVRAEDVSDASEENPTRLRLVGEAPAGAPFEGIVGAGEAVAIMTGGIIPDGADAVVQIEVTEMSGEEVLIRRATPAGTAIRPAGEDLRAGEEILSPGRRITPADIGVLATLGYSGVPVRIKPKVAILSTGDELVDVTATPGRGQLRNSSGPALIAAVNAAGAETIDLGIVGDDRDELESQIETGLQYDVLITTGGVSAGAFDYVQHIFPEAGVEVAFHGVAMKPGKPVMFGTLDEGDLRTWVFGLPGNPVSSLVTYEVFVRPLIARLLGEEEKERTFAARLKGSIGGRLERRQFQRGKLSIDETGQPIVEPLAVQSSGAMSSLSRGDVLIVVPEEVDRIDEGEMVEVIRI